MNVVDATCIECGKPIFWLSGAPRLCSDCRSLLSPLQSNICGNPQNSNAKEGAKDADAGN
jgi:predicted amidophosphoribosyltransferase